MKYSSYICFIVLLKTASSWTPDVKPKLQIKYDREKIHMFFGNSTDYFKILDQDTNSILVGARNAVYNVSIDGLRENHKQRIQWYSSEAHKQLCILKGKHDNDCQNYIKVFARKSDNQIMICGTNSYKPQCRTYVLRDDDTYEQVGSETEAQGVCPYNPEHNSTYIYTDGQLYSATVADFSGADSLIYRETQRTEQYDLKQLNQPAFISAVEHNGYVFFFFREIAMEFMNCGKAQFSRVGRVCKNDKGGPFRFSDRWTTFLKTRLNCSVPGEYPFYFDELQSTTNIINGIYNGAPQGLVYAVFTTPENSIPGSAVCAFSIGDILDAFEGRFKAQKDINSNWLPVPAESDSGPRPGNCVDDSRTLPSGTYNFVKTHSLMETAVNSFNSGPLLLRTNNDYKLTAIAVDQQIKALNGQTYDVVFVGTTNGQVVKFINIFESGKPTVTNVISEVQVLPYGMAVKELTIAKEAGALIVLGNGNIVSIPLHDCGKLTHCSDCLLLQDPYCIWDIKNRECTSNKMGIINNDTSNEFIQDILGTHRNVCKKYGDNGNSVDHYPTVSIQSTHGTVSSVGRLPIFDKEITMTSIDGVQLTNAINSNHNSNNIPHSDSISKDRSLDESAAGNTINMSTVTWLIVPIIFLILGLFLGLCIKRNACRHHSNFNSESRNHLSWPSPGSKSRHIIPPRGKDINLLMNAAQFASAPCNNKKDNLEHAFDGGKDRSHECKNSTESLEKEIPPKGGGGGVGGGTGTLQKVKKTYI